jgi:DNA-binding MarR family transcriptional regulator
VKPPHPSQHSRTDEDGGKSVAADIEGLDVAPITSSLGYLLRRLQLSFKKHFIRVAGPDSVQPNQVGAMVLIGLNPGITPSQLCTALGMDGAQVATMLNMLELRKLIARRSSKADGRSRAVHLTAAGKREFEKVRTVALDAEHSFVGDSLSAEETRLLISLLSRLLAGLRE